MHVRCIFIHTGDFMTTRTLHHHLAPRDGADRLALALTRLSRWFADRFFGDRYAHRAVVLETVAAVPGMVGATLQHLRALRRLDDDAGRVRLLTEEAENEHMHLTTFLAVAQPTRFERAMILAAQGVFFNLYFLLYLLSPRTAHRMVGYFEEEAVVSYTRFLDAIDQGRIADTPAPPMAIGYWRLAADARLRDVVLAVRRDEMGHRDANHRLADQLGSGSPTLAAGR
jgi:ubiquinol oxidase